MTIDHPVREDIPALRRLWQQAFGDTDAFLDSFFALAFAPERALTVKKAEQIVAALYWFPCAWGDKKADYIYAVATEEGFRGQGLCKKLMEKVHQELAEENRGTILVPANDGLRTFYESLGYRDFGGMEEKRFLPRGEVVKGERLTAGAYALRRRALLPHGGVLQEGALLPFLEKQLEFYGGEGWLLSGRQEEGTFVAAEYLGEEEWIPGILKALRVSSASVRLDGKTPFAMYRSPDGENSRPGYFAFALD